MFEAEGRLQQAGEQEHDTESFLHHSFDRNDQMNIFERLVGFFRDR